MRVELFEQQRGAGPVACDNFLRLPIIRPNVGARFIAVHECHALAETIGEQLTVSLVSAIDARSSTGDKFDRRKLGALVELLKIRMLAIGAGTALNYF